MREGFEHARISPSLVQREAEAHARDRAERQGETVYVYRHLDVFYVRTTVEVCDPIGSGLSPLPAQSQCIYRWPREA